MPYICGSDVRANRNWCWFLQKKNLYWAIKLIDTWKVLLITFLLLVHCMLEELLAHTFFFFEEEVGNAFGKWWTTFFNESIDLNLGDTWFQQGREIITLHRTEFLGRVVSQTGDIHCPSTSYDPTPFNLFLSDYLTEKVCPQTGLSIVTQHRWTDKSLIIFDSSSKSHSK